MIGCLVPNQMRYQAALLPDTGLPLGMAAGGRKRECRVHSPRGSDQGARAGGVVGPAGFEPAT